MASRWLPLLLTLAVSCSGSVSDALFGGSSNKDPVFPDAASDVLPEVPGLSKPDAFVHPGCDTKVCPWGQKCDPATGECAVPENAPGKLASDFALPDHNENSATNGQTVRLTDQAGNVTVVYFTLSTCATCMQQASRLWDIVATLGKIGHTDLKALLINHPQADGLVMEMGKTITLPILQDGWDNSVWMSYQADKDHMYLLDRHGFIRHFWAWIDLKTERNTVMEAMEALLEE